MTCRAYTSSSRRFQSAAALAVMLNARRYHGPLSRRQAAHYAVQLLGSTALRPPAALSPTVALISAHGAMYDACCWACARIDDTSAAAALRRASVARLGSLPAYPKGAESGG